MSLDEWVQPTVDPEVRAYVSSLVSAVGGTSIEEHGRYVLGDDALGCLKDLKRWIRFYDQKLNRLDVQRVLAESNLVKGDLLEILAGWTEEQSRNRFKSKIALACLELLVPLTWPSEIDDDRVTINHHRHLPYLRQAQVEYKRAILHHDSAKILKTATRVALPSISLPRSERPPRDEGIIRLVLYFFRNVAMLSKPADLPSDVDEAEISRSVTIDAFAQQLTFDVLLTVSSGMGDQFALQDVIILEILFNLLKGIDAEQLFMDEVQVATTKNDELKDLMQKEKALVSNYKRYAPSRHNRFGTMMWMKREDEKRTTLTGQSVISGPGRDLAQLDKSKKWNKPQFRGRKADVEPTAEFNRSIQLTTSARKNLRKFVGQLIDSGFNPLFAHLRKTIEREFDRVQKIHITQFFYLISWFLKAECARRKAGRQKREAEGGPLTSLGEPRDEGFAFVAGVLNQETFILLNRCMQRAMDDKDWQELNAEMKCFTQVLLTVQEMSDSLLDDDQEIAENIQARLFYEESTHDRIVKILRDYKDQGFGYLDACTELAHVFIRMIERYSKQNADMQVRSKRRARRKRQRDKPREGTADNDEQQSDAEAHREAEITSRERKFEFTRFQARFMNQSVVDTFIAFLRYFNDLSVEQLKRVHRYLYRVAFKNDLGVVLYRIDVIRLIHKIVQGPEGLDTANPCYKDWHEFAKQLFRRMIKKLQDRPELFVEMLFSKRPETIFYLEHGYDREVTKKVTRAAAELQLKKGVSSSQGIGALIGMLVTDEKTELVAWMQQQLEKAHDERKSWADMDASRIANGEETPSNPTKAPSILIRPDSDEIRKAMFKNGRLRLLMSLVGFERLGLEDDPDASYIVPSTITYNQLKESKATIQNFIAQPQEYDDGRDHQDLIRRKPTTSNESTDDILGVLIGDDSEDDGQFVGNEEFLFPAGGPTVHKSDAIQGLKKRRLSRKRPRAEIDDEEKLARAKARQEKELEKRRKIKSELFVRESDDESDDERDIEFLAREEAQRRTTRDEIRGALNRLTMEGASRTAKAVKRTIHTTAKPPSRKRRRQASDYDDEDDVDEQETVFGSDELPIPISDDAMSSDASSISDEEGLEAGVATEETPMSSQQHLSPRKQNDTALGEASQNSLNKNTSSILGVRGNSLHHDDSDEDAVVVKTLNRRRPARAGFLVDSDSD